MDSFVGKHHTKITGTLSCFDRIIFKGHLSLTIPGAMDQLFNCLKLPIKAFKFFVTKQAQVVKEHAKKIAERADRDFLSFSYPVKKEALARRIAEEKSITQGLVCVITAVEPCTSFRLVPADKRPTMKACKRKCLHIYFYFMDREFGLMHIRIQTWFPMTIQVYINGHEWLARKMDRHGLRYKQLDNAFIWLEDPGRAQKLADKFVNKNWPRVLHRFALMVNPLLRGILKNYQYYWVVDQSEFATDILFESRQSLYSLYRKLLRYATLCLSAEDVLTFLGKRLNGLFTGEVLNDFKKRWPGARLKHRMKENWIKMYDKHGCVLRIETVINRPYDVRVRRLGKRDGKEVMGWFPMNKRVSNLFRYAEVSLRANKRYLEALSVVDDPTKAYQALEGLVKRVRRKGRNYRGLNPLSPRDSELFSSVTRGENLITGFRNKHVRYCLFKPTKDKDVVRRNSAKVTRLLKLLHVHGLIAKIPRSRRWRVTKKGWKLMSASLCMRKESLPHAIMQVAA